MKRLFLIIAFWAAGVAGASAQMRLTLPQALDLALSENPTVKVAEMEVQRYDYVKRQTWGNLLPQISASGSYTRSIVKSEMRGGISFGADNTFAVQGDLSLPLFAPSVYRTLKMNTRNLYRHNPTVTLMRTSIDENKKIGEKIAEKLNMSKGKTALILPLKGVSAIDREGQPFYGVKEDEMLFDTLRKNVDKDKVEIIELENNINDKYFAETAAKKLIDLMNK